MSFRIQPTLPLSAYSLGAAPSPPPATAWIKSDPAIQPYHSDNVLEDIFVIGRGTASMFFDLVTGTLQYKYQQFKKLEIVRSRLSYDTIAHDALEASINN